MQKVRYVFCDERVKLRPELDKFEFRPKKGWVWLQRACFWLLSKIGAFALAEEKVVYRTVEIDTDKFMNKVLGQVSQACRRGQNPTKLLCGAEDYQRLMGEVCGDSLHFQASYYERGYDGKVTVHGLTVHIVPWMEGILVLPEGI